jgi:rod shape-determining protein MreD
MGLNSERSVHDPLSAVLLRAAMVFAATAFLAILGAMPIFSGRLAFLKPDFLFAAIFYWTVLRARFCPLSVTFVSGVLSDIVLGTPPGLTALVLVLLQVTVDRQRKFFSGQPFVVLWTCLAIALFLATILRWGVLSLLSGAALPVSMPLAQVLATTLFFPLLAPVYALFLKALANR